MINTVIVQLLLCRLPGIREDTRRSAFLAFKVVFYDLFRVAADGRLLDLRRLCLFVLRCIIFMTLLLPLVCCLLIHGHRLHIPDDHLLCV